MKNTCVRLVVTILSHCFITSSWSQPITREDYNDVNRYTITVIPSDFNQSFLNGDDKKDFRRLREYLFSKEDLLQSIQSEKNTNHSYWGHTVDQISVNIKYYRSIVAEMEKDLESAKHLQVVSVNKIWVYDARTNPSLTTDPKDTGNVLLSSNQLGGYLALFKGSLQTSSEDSVHVNKLDSNILNVKMDIISATNQIDLTLSPEIKQQEFRANITLYFTALLGVLLIAYFFLLYKKTGDDLSKELIGPTGLQFITLFVLIIAVILFGILGILERSELSAILSGISGYILGKGILSDKTPPHPLTPPAPPNPQ